jgi:methanogenic corrinoid protein MtbC1
MMTPKTLTPRELGQAIGVSESSLKRWADDGRLQVGRTAGGHRRIAVSEAIRFIREAGLPLLKPQLMGLGEMEAVGTAGLSKRPLHETLVSALIEGRAADVRGLVASAYVAGTSVAQLCDGPLAHAMYAVGDLWHHDRFGIAVEHRAALLCAQALHQITALLPPPLPHAPVAVGGAPSEDIYTLASMMAATVLLSEGWTEVNLGAQLPLDVLETAATKHQARLVWLSLSVEQSARKAARDIDKLASTLADRGVRMVVGGRAARELGPVLHKVQHAASMAELAAFARGLSAAGAGVTGGAVTHRGT